MKKTNPAKIVKSDLRLNNPITVTELSKRLAEQLDAVPSTIRSCLEYGIRSGKIQYDRLQLKQTRVDRVQATNYVIRARNKKSLKKESEG